MKKNKFALLAFALLFACSLNAKGNAVQPEHQGIKQPFSGNTAVLSDESDYSYYIQMVWIYTTCPNGKIRAVGVIGLNDQGQMIDYLYWGETEACKNDQVLIFV